MTTDPLHATCAKCGAARSMDSKQPCPACGGYGRRFVAEVTEGAVVGASFGGWLTRRREYLQQRRPLKWTLAAVTVGSPFVGLIVSGVPGVLIGLIVGMASWYAGPRAVMKVQEVVRERL